MNRRLLSVISVLLILAGISICGLAQQQTSPARGTILVPPSSLPVAGMPHTPLLVFVPESGPQPSIPAGETPASIACLYGITQQVPGCPKSGTNLPTGGSRAIAVIEYGKTSTMVSDLNKFSTTFGLPAANVTEVCVEASCPSNNGSGWDLGTSLDVQWAHAMAPNAQLFVVESGVDLFSAVDKANALISAAGGGEISNSWVTSTGGEPPNESQLDLNFQTPGIVYFAAAGDWGLGALYPSASPYVVSAGGTTVQRDGSGNYTGEKCWSDSGGGISRYETRPAYQRMIGNLSGTLRGTPDWAAVADPASGVAVYSTTYCGGWCIVGGTSAASPILAAIVNQLGTFSNTTANELTKTYFEYTNSQYLMYFHDIVTGNNGAPAVKGWDTCTGLGTPKNPNGL